MHKSYQAICVRRLAYAFYICSDANGWDKKLRAVKLPTLLEGEALATWLDLSGNERQNYVRYCEGKTHCHDGII